MHIQGLLPNLFYNLQNNPKKMILMTCVILFFFIFLNQKNCTWWLLEKEIMVWKYNYIYVVKKHIYIWAKLWWSEIRKQIEQGVCHTMSFPFTLKSS
jgi:hypothetical protein